LHPGDLIFTGTPGETPEIRPGDTLDIELEGVGVLSNPVIQKRGGSPFAPSDGQDR
jgi:2-keto-4-pentenoate hydratase/2-oxohepta-3-ene-1,7-dioic acid hydratase in catechol pathway